MNRLEDLVRWLGPDAAIAGLERSDLTIAELQELDAGGGNQPHAKLKRADLIKVLVSAVRKRLTKPPEALMQMDIEALKAYFIEIKASREEILALLLELDIRPGSSAKTSLVDFAAREISDIGMYRRVASGGDRKDGERKE